MSAVKDALQRMRDQTVAAGLSTSAMPAPTTPVPPTFFPTTGALRAISTDDGIEIRTVAGGDTVFVYRGHFSDKTAEHWSPEATALSWSPDGTRIAFARFDGRIYVWQAA